MPKSLPIPAAMLALAALAAWPSLPPSARAADILWATGSTGDWNDTDNWQGGGALPSVSDTVSFGSGAATLAAPVTTAAAGIGITAGETASVTISSGGLWMPNGADLAVPSGTFIVGHTGTGFLTIESGGIVRVSGTTNGGNAHRMRIGELAGSYGEVVVKSGALMEAGGINVGTSGSGVLRVEAGGTLSQLQANAGIYVALAAGSYGRVEVDGYYISGNNGAYYIPVGYTAADAVGVFNVGASGTVISGQIDIGKHATTSGTVTIAGNWEIKSGNSSIGNNGKGTLIIKDGGYLHNVAAGNFTIGNAGPSGDVLIETGGRLEVTGNRFWVGNNAVNSSLTIEAGSRLVRTRPTTGNYDSFLIGGNITSTHTSANAAPQNVSGTVTVNGFLDAGSYIHLGNGGNGYLYIGQSGTVLSNGVRLTYGDWNATAYAEVHGVWNNLTVNGHNGYLIVAHYGDSYMKIGPTGIFTTDPGQYISIGQGDGTGNPRTYSGTLDVEGYARAGTYLQVGNSMRGVLNIASSGTVIAGSYGRIGANNDSTGIINLDGYLSIGTYLDNGYNTNGIIHVGNGATLRVGTYVNNGRVATATGFLDIAALSDVTIGGYYSQNANSTLRVELSSTRPPDALAPSLPSPVLSIGGAAALSGTLLVHGPDIATTIPDFQWDANGEARASSLTGVPVLRAAGGITGNFNTIEIDGLTIPSTLPDFIRGGGLKVNEGGPLPTRYDIGYGLAWNSGVDAAHGTFTVEAGKTFNVDVQLADRPGLVFDSSWDGQSLVKKGPGTLVLSVENAYTGLTTIEEGTLKFAGPAEITLGDLVNKGVIDFGSTDATATGDTGARYRTLRAASLSGTGAFRMGVNLDTGVGDRLVIRGDATGAYRLLITATGSVPTGVEPKSELVTIGGVNDISFTGEGTAPGSTLIIDGAFDSGPFNYEVKMEGNRIVILKTGLDPAVFAPIRGVPGAQSALWFDQQDNLSRRLGELRAPRENGSGFDLWARAHAASASIGGGSTDTRLSDVDFWGAELGADYTWMLDGDRVTLGLFAGTGNASQDFRSSPYSTATGTAYNTATGESDLTGAGLYAAWLGDTGWFANATLAAARYKNSFTAIDGSFNHTTGDYDETGIGATVEAGRRIPLAFLGDGWFVEPALQGALTRLTRGNYLTKGTSPLSVQGSAVSISRARATLRAGRAWEINSLGWLELTARASALRERSSGGEINIGPEKWRPNLDGNRYEAGLGLCWRPFDSGQIYFDYEYAAGDNYEKPWSLSLGFRLSL